MRRLLRMSNDEGVFAAYKVAQATEECRADIDRKRIIVIKKHNYSNAVPSEIA